MINMYSNCNDCLNSRTILSENGYKVICCLSDKKAADCVLSDYNKYYVTRFMLERGNYEL